MSEIWHNIDISNFWS